MQKNETLQANEGDALKQLVLATTSTPKVARRFELDIHDLRTSINFGWGVGPIFSTRLLCNSYTK